MGERQESGVMSMAKKITIRKARPGEGQLLSEVAFRSKSHWGYSREFMAACRAELTVSKSDISNPARYYVVAQLNETIIGYYALERLPSDECELEALFVEPNYTGQGVGRSLIEHAKSHARRLGAASMRIQGDPNAMAFYLAAGGIQIGERESESIPGRYLPVFSVALQ